jgi:hypothetical protein
MRKSVRNLLHSGHAPYYTSTAIALYSWVVFTFGLTAKPRKTYLTLPLEPSGIDFLTSVGIEIGFFAQMSVFGRDWFRFRDSVGRMEPEKLENQKPII